MEDDVKVAIGHVVNIIGEALRKREEESVELPRPVRNFWNKIKKRLPEEVGPAMEASPTEEAARASFTEGMGELMKAKNIKMNMVMFLYNQGIELE
jgi:hypothetical protein